ncbi:MAG: HlyC/CorC family transporter [Alphaproteobacteria bacterium]
MHSREKEGDGRATLVNKLREKKDRMIGAILLGNNLVNILATSLTTSVLFKMVGEAGVVYATLVMTVLVLIFAEVLPKTYAIQKADDAALKVARPISFITFVFAPVTEMIGWIVTRILIAIKAIDPHGVDEAHEEELRGAIDLHGNDGGDPEDRQESKMMRSILDLADVETDAVMTHRSRLFMIDAGQPMEQIINQVLESPYTRIPVYEGDQDNITGVIHAKQLFMRLQEAGGDYDKVSLADVASDPWFVPDTANLFDQLQHFKQRREHFALVVDEYGSLLGVITLEDILEEIVGEITDEHDVPMKGVRRQPDGSYLVTGAIPVRDLNREYDWSLPVEDFSTIAGLLLYESRSLPEVGNVYTFYNFRFEVMRRQKNQVTLVRVTPPEVVEERNSLTEA